MRTRISREQVVWTSLPLPIANGFLGYAAFYDGDLKLADTCRCTRESAADRYDCCGPGCHAALCDSGRPGGTAFTVACAVGGCLGGPDTLSGAAVERETSAPFPPSGRGGPLPSSRPRPHVTALGVRDPG